MAGSDAAVDLVRYLQAGRDAVLWKLEGLSEYDCRRPLTPTGTNLLGLVKHLAGVELGYFGAPFGRPLQGVPTWVHDQSEPNQDMWATAEESRGQIVALYQRAWEHAAATIDALGLTAMGQVPWWPADRREVTLHRVLVHVIAETHRHAGHADIVREIIDGAAGLRAGDDCLVPGDSAWWSDYRRRLEQAAAQA